MVLQSPQKSENNFFKSPVLLGLIKLGSSAPGISKANGFALCTLDPALLDNCEEALDSISTLPDSPRTPFTVSLSVTVPGSSVSVLLFAATLVGAAQRGIYLLHI